MRGLHEGRVTPRDGKQALAVLGPVLHGLQREKAEAEAGGGEQGADRGAAPAQPRGGHGERHRQAGGEQERGVGRADPEVEGARGGDGLGRVLHAGERDRGEEAAKEHDLAAKEDVGAHEVGGVLLLAVGEGRSQGDGLGHSPCLSMA